MILEYHDFEVVTAADVNDALQLIGSQTFDVLLSDLHMPNPGDGPWLNIGPESLYWAPKLVSQVWKPKEIYIT